MWLAGSAANYRVLLPGPAHPIFRWRNSLLPHPPVSLLLRCLRRELEAERLTRLSVRLDARTAVIRFRDARALRFCLLLDPWVWVYFTDADVVHVGDTWWNGVYRFIDYSTGGSIDGQIQAAEANLAAFTNKTIFIPGNGPVGGRSDLAEFRDMLVTIRENVAALKKQGRQ